jgi:hypothetical protein
MVDPKVSTAPVDQNRRQAVAEESVPGSRSCSDELVNILPKVPRWSLLLRLSFEQDNSRSSIVRQHGMPEPSSASAGLWAPSREHSG